MGAPGRPGLSARAADSRPQPVFPSAEPGSQSSLPRKRDGRSRAQPCPVARLGARAPLPRLCAIAHGACADPQALRCYLSGELLSSGDAVTPRETFGGSRRASASRVTLRCSPSGRQLPLGGDVLGSVCPPSPFLRRSLLPSRVHTRSFPELEACVPAASLPKGPPHFRDAVTN